MAAEEALVAAHECGLPLVEQHCRLALAAARCAAGDLAEADEAARRAESGYRKGGNGLGEARALWLRSRIAGRAGDPTDTYRERGADLLTGLDLPRRALGRHA
ncbi:MAG TPA: hypothetical protein VGN37_19315 [Actinocatenispora sp.]